MWIQISSHLQEVLALFGGVGVVAGALVAIAYGIFKKFGEKWLDARFDERREALKHEQQKELEALRIQFARLIDRATKLNQREFDAIPEAWARLYEAYERTRSLGAPLQTYPDVDNMTSEHRNEFIGACELYEWEKKELSSVENKTDYYVKRLFWHKLAETQKYAQELHLYVIKNSIFMPMHIRKQFQQIDQLIRTALIEQEHNHRYGYESTIIEEWDKFIKEGETIMTGLGKAIEQRLASLTEAKSL